MGWALAEQRLELAAVAAGTAFGTVAVAVGRLGSGVAEVAVAAVGTEAAEAVVESARAPESSLSYDTGQYTS